VTYDHPMGWAGFIVAVLGTIGTIVGTCVTIASFRRDRREHSQHANSKEHPGQAQGSRSRWVWPNILALDVIVLAVLAAGIFLITQSHGAPGRPSGQGTTPSSSTKPASPSPSAGTSGISTHPAVRTGYLYNIQQSPSARQNASALTVNGKKYAGAFQLTIPSYQYLKFTYALKWSMVIDQAFCGNSRHRDQNRNPYYG
jgi:hypothetical protein